MAEIIRMPRLSDTMEMGTIVTWRKQVGDTIKAGDVLAEVETDKAVIELEIFTEGTLLHLPIAEKAIVPINGVIAVIGEQGEDFQSLLLEASNVETARNDASAALHTIGEISRGQGAGLDVVRMPSYGDTMTEGKILRWHKQVGDYIKAADILVEVETGKANVELESYRGGHLLYIAAETGAQVVENQILAIIGKQGSDFSSILNQEKTN